VGHTYFGAELECSVQDLIQRMIFYFGVWEPTLSRVIEARLSKGHLFVDIGANIGYYSLLGAKCVGSEGQVIAIEASRDIFCSLERNLARNKAANVRALNIAAADREGTLLLYPGPAWNMGRTTTLQHRSDTSTGTQVRAAPLETILSTDEISRVSFIKIDVEGAEGPILAHFLETLNLYPADVQILVEMAEPIPEDEAKLQAMFQNFLSAGFRAYGFDNRYDINWYLNWRFPAPPHQLETYPAEQCDVLLTRRPFDF
jgi:FkbM family methyltransferase